MNFKDKKALIIISITTILVIAILGMVIGFKNVIDKPLKIQNEEILSINEGDSFYSTMENLSTNNKIKSVSIIKIYTKITGSNLEVLPGKYSINKDMSLNELIKTLTSESNLNETKFTVPEGYSIDDISQKLQSEGICSAEEFIKAVQEYPLPPYVKNNTEKRYNLEGFLFPDTYKFEKGTEPSKIVGTMVDRFYAVWTELTNELKVNVKDEDIEKIITIASMIEKEARADDERALISSVIYNRVEEGMLLQIDATVLYAHGYHLEQVLYEHLEIDSPYNTYMYKGLPVGPICNPGALSIIAAIKPEKTDYLFYLLETDKHHYFTNNYADFEMKKEELGY